LWFFHGLLWRLLRLCLVQLLEVHVERDLRDVAGSPAAEVRLLQERAECALGGAHCRVCDRLAGDGAQGGVFPLVQADDLGDAIERILGRVRVARARRPRRRQPGVPIGPAAATMTNSARRTSSQVSAL
jgi:hypothetical protein